MSELAEFFAYVGNLKYVYIYWVLDKSLSLRYMKPSGQASVMPSSVRSPQLNHPPSPHCL